MKSSIHTKIVVFKKNFRDATSEQQNFAIAGVSMQHRLRNC
jgi:hypothetical protein